MIRYKQQSGSAKIVQGFVTGHDFSRAENADKSTRASVPAGFIPSIPNNLPATPTGDKR